MTREVVREHPWSRALRLACALALMVLSIIGAVVAILGDPGNPSQLEYYWAPAFGPMPFVAAIGGLAGLHPRAGPSASLATTFVLVQVQAAAVIHRPRGVPAPPVADWIVDAVLTIQPALVLLAIAALLAQFLCPSQHLESAPPEADP